MNACSDFIQFDRSDDWQQVIGITKNAQIFSDNSHVPISPFDLGVAITEPYVVIVVQAIDGKTTWRYGGEVRQTWDFPRGGQIGTAFNKAQSQATPMGLNKPQIIGLTRNTTDTFRLSYHSPTWFRGVIVIGWKYIGAVENFTKDTLFNIGNKVGVGTLNQPDSIPNLIASQQALLESIENRLINLENNPNNPTTSVSLTAEQNQQINQIVADNISNVNSRLDSFSNNLSDVLSGESDPDILTADSDRQTIEDEFT